MVSSLPASRRVLIPVAVAAAPVPPPAGAQAFRLDGVTMGTGWSVQGWHDPAVPTQDVATLRQGIESVLESVDAQMSNWRADSPISAFNRAEAGSWHTLPPACFAVLQAALTMASQSGGAYDPSAGPLVDLWGFGPTGPLATAPSPEAVRAARARCGWQRIEIDAGARRVLQAGGVSLDLCAIAKGYAVDAVSAWLAAQGVPHHLVEIGGELRGEGIKPDGMPWWVELETPPDAAGSDAGGATMAALHGLSVATSGDYRRYFVDEGRRYAHTLDPRTGYPASHALASVTVLHRHCMLADAWSTALTVLGPEAGLVLARRHGIAARLLARTPTGFAETVTPAFVAMLA